MNFTCWGFSAFKASQPHGLHLGALRSRLLPFAGKKLAPSSPPSSLQTTIEGFRGLSLSRGLLGFKFRFRVIEGGS